MRIGINSHFINNPFCGSGQYLARLLQAMKKVAPENEYLVFGNPYKSDLGQVFWEQIYFPFLCWKHKVDLIFVPYFAPPLFTSKLTVATVHDITSFLFSPKLWRTRLYNWFIKQALKRVALILVDSKSTKKNLVEIFRINESKIKVLQLANTL